MQKLISSLNNILNESQYGTYFAEVPLYADIKKDLINQLENFLMRITYQK